MKSDNITFQTMSVGYRHRFDPGCRMDGNFSSLLRVRAGPGVQSASYEMSTGGFLGVKAARRRARQPTSS